MTHFHKTHNKLQDKMYKMAITYRPHIYITYMCDLGQGHNTLLLELIPGDCYSACPHRPNRLISFMIIAARHWTRTRTLYCEWDNFSFT